MTDAATASAPPAVKPAGPFSAWEIGLALRYLRAKRKEGGVALIAIISFVGIMLAVAVLISVMSIMAGFRGTLMDRILSFNGHMYVQGPVLYAPDRDAALKRVADVPDPDRSGCCGGAWPASAATGSPCTRATAGRTNRSSDAPTKPRPADAAHSGCTRAGDRLWRADFAGARWRGEISQQPGYAAV